MPVSLINRDNVTDNPTLHLDLARSVTTAVVGGTTYLFAAGWNDDGISVFSVAEDGTLANVDNVTDNATLELDGAYSLTTAVVGGTTYLFAAGEFDDGISVFSVAANGTLTNVENVTDAGALMLNGVSSLTTTVIGGNTYLIAAGRADNGFSTFSVAANGTLTNIQNIYDAGVYELFGAHSVTTAVVGGTTYLFVAGLDDDGISVFSMRADGVLTANVDNVPDDATLQLDGVWAVTTAVVGGTTYLFAAGDLDDGISVFSVGTDGKLTNVYNLTDTPALALDQAQTITTAVIDGTTYLFVPGTLDNGVSAFSVAANGTLTHVDTVFDNATLQLDGATSLTTAEIGGLTYLFASSVDDDGVSVFAVTDAILGTSGNDVLIGTGGGDTFYGFAGSDTIAGSGGADTLYGGDGNDFLNGGTGGDMLIGGTGDDTYYVDSTLDSITENFNEGVDTVRSSITYSLQSNSNLENLTLEGASAINGTGNKFSNVIYGSAASNTLSGLDSNDEIHGGGSNDFLFGGNGSDTLYGDAGNDYLDGGASFDTMYGGSGDDEYLVDSFFDSVVELAGEGVDKVLSSATYSLQSKANVENLTLIGALAINGTGNDLANSITGNGANNILIGNGGNDILTGGMGADTQTGGTGADWFSYVVPAEFGDTVVDFNNFEGDKFTLGGSNHTLSEAGVDFVLGLTPRSGQSTVMVQGNELWWDQDGTGAGAALQVADVFGLGTGHTDIAGLGAAGWSEVATGDFNSDGRTDILWKNDASGATAAWLMGPDGTPGTTPFYFSVEGWDLAASGDLGGYPANDLLWRNDAGQTAVWQMAGGAVVSNYFSLDSTGWTPLGQGDFNNDGITDVLWRQDATGTTASWLMREGTPTATPIYLSAAGWDLAAIADVNGDGTSDMIWQQGNQVAEWLMQPGSGTVQSATFVGDAGTWTLIGNGDFNGDGIEDLLWKNTDGTVASWLMDNAGEIVATPFYQSAAGWDLVATGDYNHDSTTDLFWKDGAGNTALWLMEPGTGELALGVLSDPVGGAHVIATGDFNGDTVDDILWGDDLGNTVVWQFSHLNPGDFLFA